jgi:uncharacterized protein (TIRG00374 family)
MTKAKRITAELLRVAISLTLLAIVLVRIDWDKALSLIKNSDPLWWTAGICVTVAAILLSAYKWRLVLIAQGTDVPLSKLTGAYFIGLFFNNFLPSSMGGDAYRAYDVSTFTKRKHSAVASVIAERILAAVALGTMAGLGLLLGYKEAGKFAGWIAVVLIGCFGILFASVNVDKVIYLGDRIRRFRDSRLRGKLSEFGDALKAPVDDKETLMSVLLLSIAFQVCVILVNVAVFRALKVDVPLRYFFIFVPLIMALGMLPVSINGWGIQEGAYILFFSRAGLSATQAVTGSISFTLTVTLVSIVGVILLISKGLPERRSHDGKSGSRVRESGPVL